MVLQECRMPDAVYCTFPGSAQGCSAVAFNPDGSCLAAVCGTADAFQIVVYDIATAARVCTFGHHHGWVSMWYIALKAMPIGRCQCKLVSWPFFQVRIVPLLPLAPMHTDITT